MIVEFSGLDLNPEPLSSTNTQPFGHSETRTWHNKNIQSWNLLRFGAGTEKMPAAKTYRAQQYQKTLRLSYLQ